jgi:hypothetical protein
MIVTKLLDNRELVNVIDKRIVNRLAKVVEMETNRRNIV